MKELYSKVHLMAVEELNRANKIWPEFVSKHEAVGVLDEEIFEMKEELERFVKHNNELHRAVYCDFDINKPLTQCERTLAAMIAEGIQCLAMCKKFRCLLERKENDHE